MGCEEAGRKIFAGLNGAPRGCPPVTASIGVVHFEKADRTFTSMMKVADELMYEVKASGINNFQKYSKLPRQAGGMH